MKNKNMIKTSAIGTGIFAGCCFGILGFILGLLGLTTALAYVNKYGDFVFFPAYSVFATVLVYALMQWKRNVYTYLASFVAIGLMIFFASFGIIWSVLVLGGIAVGSIISWTVHKKTKSGAKK